MPRPASQGVNLSPLFNFEFAPRERGRSGRPRKRGTGPESFKARDMQDSSDSNQIAVIPARAAELLGLSVSGLAKMRMRGDGPAFAKIGRRRVVYRIEAQQEWVAGREKRSTHEPQKLPIARRAFGEVRR
jgi:hypothetical protein